MNEKELLEKIRHSAENITPPEALHPDNIEILLQSQTKTASDSTLASDTRPNSRQSRKKHTNLYRLGSIAAVFAIAILGLYSMETYRKAEMTTPFTQSEKPQDTQELAAPIPETATVKNTASSLPDAATEIAGARTASDNVITEALTTAESYEAIYEQLYEKFGSPYSDEYGVFYDAGMGIMEMVVEDVIMEESIDLAASSMTTSSSADSAVSRNDTAAVTRGTSYSRTNVQEAGVDEADLVKTDGAYIYVLKRSGSLIILSAKEGIMESVSQLSLPSDETIHEMYIDGDLLSLITSGYTTELDTSRDNVIASRSTDYTSLYTYDISDRTAPKLTGTVTQDGSYSQSRKNGSYIYLFTRFFPEIHETYEESYIIPRTTSGEVSASSIYIPENLNVSSYLVVSSTDIHHPDKTIDQKAILSVASTFYASPENIYIANETWKNDATYTELLKLNYKDGSITGTAAGAVEGYLNDSFSLNEYNGYLRVVSTSYDENYDEINGLYIFDENLNLTGSIRDLAPDETIRSARFFGNTGYFVTFRQTDPLFSVDLSNPSNPKILGELKITGFSSYLHFYSDDLLLGLGYEADPETGIQTSLKLSMFDISDPTDVTETDKLVLDGITWCASLEDYKSILMDPEKNIFGFTCDNRYLVFSYDEEKGFVNEFLYDFYQDTLNGYPSSSEYDTRGLYINDTFYLVRPDVATSFDMENDFALIGQIALGSG